MEIPPTVPVSVAIPALGRRQVLLGTLARIASCIPRPAEILIHADGGWDPELDSADFEGIPLRVLTSDVLIGPGGGRDKIIRVASNDIVASFDNDSWPMDPDFFARAFALMEAFPKALVLCAAVYLKEKPPLPCMPEVSEERFFEGSGSIHRRSLYQQLPGYVPVPEAYGVEEADLALQAHAAGMQVLSSPWLRVWHDRPNADYLHAVLPWIKNEVLFGYLRYPRFMQPWAWWRSVRHVMRHRSRVPLFRLLLALAQSPAHCMAFDDFRHRYRARVILRKNSQPLRRWTLVTDGSAIRNALLAPQPRRVVYLQYTNPAHYPPLAHSSHILARQGWEVLFLGLHTGQEQDFVFPPHLRIRVLSMRAASPGLWQKVHYLIFSLWCVHHVHRFEAEWIYASDPFSTVAANWLARRGRQVLYHEHDSPTVIPGVKMDAISRFFLRQRAKLAQRARAVVLPNERRLQAFLEQTNARARSFCVWNCPALDEVPALPGVPKQPQTGPLRVLYHGSINPARFPVSMLQALKLSGPGVIMRLVGYETDGSIGYTAKLRNEASRLGIEDQFETLGPLQRGELMVRCGECHVGLSLLHISPQDINRQHMAGASNKPFDYLSQGLALVVPADADWNAFFVSQGCARPCPINDGEALAQVLAWFRAHRPETAAIGAHGQELIRSRWNYENQFKPVLHLMESPPP